MSYASLDASGDVFGRIRCLCSDRGNSDERREHVTSTGRTAGSS
jgi:hypothetical protein